MGGESEYYKSSLGRTRAPNFLNKVEVGAGEGEEKEEQEVRKDAHEKTRHSFRIRQACAKHNRRSAPVQVSPHDFFNHTPSALRSSVPPRRRSCTKSTTSRAAPHRAFHESCLLSFSSESADSAAGDLRHYCILALGVAPEL